MIFFLLRTPSSESAEEDIFSHVIKGNLRKCHKIHFNSRDFFLSPLIGGEVGKPWYDYIWSSLFVCVEINIMTKIRISIHVGGNIKKLQFQTALFWHFFCGGEFVSHTQSVWELNKKARHLFNCILIFLIRYEQWTHSIFPHAIYGSIVDKSRHPCCGLDSLTGKIV